MKLSAGREALLKPLQAIIGVVERRKVDREKDTRLYRLLGVARLENDRCAHIHRRNVSRVLGRCQPDARRPQPGRRLVGDKFNTDADGHLYQERQHQQAS